MGTEPDIASTAPIAYRPWIEELARFIEERGPDLTPLPPRPSPAATKPPPSPPLVAWSEDNSPERAATAARRSSGVAIGVDPLSG